MCSKTALTYSCGHSTSFAYQPCGRSNCTITYFYDTSYSRCSNCTRADNAGKGKGSGRCNYYY